MINYLVHDNFNRWSKIGHLYLSLLTSRHYYANIQVFWKSKIILKKNHYLCRWKQKRD